MANGEIEQLIDELSGSRRRARQDASHEIAIIAKEDPDALVEYADELIDALFRPEAQTRWEIMDALSDMALAHPETASEAYDAVEPSLYDEKSAAVRLSAFHYLTVLGATNPKRSEKAWNLLDGAVQCFHGDPEYRDMLMYLIDFAQGDISDKTRKGMKARIEFDAKNGKGYIKAWSKDIYDIVDVD